MLLVATIGLICLYFLIIKPAIRKRRFIREDYPPQVQRCHHLFTQLYHGVNAAQIADSERKRTKQQGFSLIYGEVEFISFVQMLDYVKPKAGEVFYDLGCGSGKAVFAAALLYDFKRCCGIEILPGLHQLCIKLHKRFFELLPQYSVLQNRTFNPQFLQDDLLNVDFTDADIIFMNATGFFGDEWGAVVEKLNQCKRGTRIIVTSKKLPKLHYRLIANGMHWMSWGVCSVMVYQKD